KNTDNAHDRSPAVTTRLISITGDSADFLFAYENDTITDVLARHDDGQQSIDTTYSPYAHIRYESNNYIKATSPADSFYYTEYFLNADHLPSQIIMHFDKWGNKDVVDFFYNPSTNLLDSVHDTNDGVHFTRAYMEYDGYDITRIKTTFPYFTGLIENNSEYDYDKTTPNVFKTTGSLFYIYQIPFGTYNFINSWVVYHQELIVKMFSHSTFNNMRYSNAGYDWQDTMHYTLNTEGKLETVSYENEPNYILRYNYK
ncbi:MAG TPA: hypothetical protein VEV83_07850, partial [Parafilimonas sp.]|nr:hypothetical protein [Parafilimonas sp.]